MTLHVALFEPEIPPNTGNIIRLCANANVTLHLIEPYGFTWEDKALRRAGLDYHEWTPCIHYPNVEVFLAKHADKRIFACTTKGSEHHHTVTYQTNDMLLFGPESRGLPQHLRDGDAIHTRIRIPMAAHSRSLNLANSVGIILYEALRQLDFPTLN